MGVNSGEDGGGSRVHINRNTVSFMEWYSLGTPGYYLTRSIETASSMWVNLVGAGGVSCINQIPSI